MTITELRKLLKNPNVRPVVWVNVTKDDGAHLDITRTEALRLLQGQDGSAEANAVLSVNELFIG